MTPEGLSLLSRGLKKLGINPTDFQQEQLELYLAEIEVWNPKYNLVKVDTPEEIITRHLLDSLAGLKLIAAEKPDTLADLGSGGGFPGIVLAIFMPETRFTLVERQGRRCRFLENAVVQTGLKNVEIKNCDLSEVKDRYDLITFRAFRPFEPDIIKGIMSVMHKDSMVFAYKGKRENALKEGDALGEYLRTHLVLPMKVPYSEGERTMLLLSSPVFAI